MKKFVAVLAAVMFAILAVVPMASASGNTFYVSSSNGKGVRLRAEPSTDAKVIMKLGEGRPVTVTDVNVANGFFGVTVKVNGKTYTGYIMSKFLSRKDPAAKAQSFKSVTPFNVKVRTATKNGVVSMWNTTDKANENKLRDLTKTEVLTVLAESGAWYQVVDANGLTGFVAKAYVKAC